MTVALAGEGIAVPNAAVTDNGSSPNTSSTVCCYILYLVSLFKAFCAVYAG